MEALTRRRGTALLAGLLVAHAVVSCIDAFKRYPGIDFYHYWAVPQATRAQPALGSPYRDEHGYAEVLARLAADAGPQHRAAATFRRQLDLTGTPASYALLGFLPRDYTAAFALFQFAQVLALAGAVALILRERGQAVELGVGFAAVLLLAFFPVTADLGLGNVNTLQLLVLAAGCALAARPGGSVRVLFPALVAAVLIKPSLLVPAGLLGLSAAARASRPALVAAATRALAVAALVVAYPCVRFGDAAVWWHWRAAVTGERLFYPPATGNWSTAGLLGNATDLPVRGLSAGLLVLLVLVPALLAADRGRRLRAIVGDPFLAAGVGVVVLLAASPLVWSHYFVLGLLPALWLACASDRAASVAGAASIVLASGLLPGLASRLLDAELSQAWLTSLSWAPLWFGLVHQASVAARTG